MKRLVVVLSVALLILGLTSGAEALNYSFTGTFVQDDDVQFFNFSVASTSTITLRTWSYAGGTNAAGLIIPDGGFDPILALFDNSGLLIAQNDDGNTTQVPADPTTGAYFDTYLETTLDAGDYIVAVSQYDNFALGPMLADGFQREGDGNFVGGFLDINGDQRNNFWAFDILNVQEASQQNPVPEPGTLFLLGTGVIAVVLLGRKHLLKK